MAWKKQWQIDIAKEQLKDEQEILRILKEATTDAQESVLEKTKKLIDRIDNEPDNVKSIIYQAKFQMELQNQIDSILSKLNNKQFASVQEFIKESYEDGVISTCYSLQQQGIPIILPIDQNEAILMASKTADGFKLSTKLHKDVIKTATAVRNEITRGIVSSLSYDEIARNISNRLNMNYNSAVRIVRTEGHRVTMQSKMQAMAKAKDKGADIVKQWDSTLDGRTRPHHRELDGQVRELDGQFSVNGLKASYPGGFGIANEDINCRCTILEVPRWVLDDSDDVTKMAEGKLLQNQQEIDMWKSLNNFPYEKGNKYNQFKKAYKKKLEEQHDIMDIIRKNSVQGKDVINTWKRNEDKYAFAIDDIVDYQGFNGKPTIVSPNEFDKLLKDSDLVFQRTYGAETKDVLDAYREALYNGEWYIDCSKGGSAFGRGMYVAGSKNINSEYLKKTMLKYQRGKAENYIETMLLSKDTKIIKYDDIWTMKNNEGEIAGKKKALEWLDKQDINSDMKLVVKGRTATGTDEELNKSFEVFQTLTQEEKDLTQKYAGKFRKIQREVEDEIYEQIKDLDLGEYAALKGYDAIDVENHGSDGYYVILNRTKVIIKDGR